ncbi:TPA: hypothetical protein DEO28_00280 [Candidatus Dependentiae bacterium]|nr:MAG: hypothetical protein UR14_C0001G0087 [candidate division TM6 bacterium GW2011_GWE2_31_21]KKP54033.1 MAG: hypothetical protein UR43_C0001G0051 [candidate division TM6 bacterium GW2011_GWF2_33_332]HBS48385.1 hypothetical protein [Candidatus Dependentiae bacterium]HBZ72941.1 hypothetical protein [Candidatus Dependentiae bacterium]
MSYFIIIRGPAGVGKTTIAKALAKSLNGYHISLDEILAKHGLDYIASETCISENKMLAANKIVIPIAKEKLAAGQIVIFDESFYHKSPIEDLISQLKFPYFVYTLKADLEICVARNKQRTNPLDEQAIKDVFKLVSKFDYGIVINTNNQTIDEIMNEILSFTK